MASVQAEPRRQQRLRPLQRLAKEQLLIHEIFGSIQGESSHAGRPCTFVRTTACNLRCTYCDTRHAFIKGAPTSVDAVLAEVQRLGLPVVEVTGGEPLLQAAVLPLLRRLADAGYTVLLETSGSLSIAEVDPRVHRIVDFKTPSSGEVAANLLDNVALLRPHDEVKFVIGSRADYDWSVAFLKHHQLARRVTVLMGVVWDALPIAHLADWLVADRLPVRLQLQLHKYIWDPQRTGV